MGRWIVKRDDSFPRRWVAVNRGDLSEIERFSTHAQALAYADEQARTRKVVLPRGPKSGTLRIDVKYAGDDVYANAVVNQKWVYGKLPAANLEGVARFLYALAERAKRAGA